MKFISVYIVWTREKKEEKEKNVLTPYAFFKLKPINFYC